jgi:DNA-binding transcriptional regulator GbsR (MarR family)
MPSTEANLSPEMGAVLNDLEKEVIDLFVQAARILGQPKSVGEIYGLLYISEKPLPMDAIIEKLQMSKGSASQGLKFLRNMRAVKLVYEVGDRRDHYLAEASLRALASGFISEEVEPHLESGKSRLERMEQLLQESEGPNGKFHAERVKRLGNWHKRSRQLLPLLMKFID